jgi:hypothetical protein
LFTLWALRSFSIQVKCASFLLLEATLAPSWSLGAACSFIPEFHEIEMLDVCVKVFRHFLIEFCSREFFDICDGPADANSPSTRSHPLLGTSHMLVKFGSCSAFEAQIKKQL